MLDTKGQQRWKMFTRPVSSLLQIFREGLEKGLSMKVNFDFFTSPVEEAATGREVSASLTQAAASPSLASATLRSSSPASSPVSSPVSSLASRLRLNSL